MTPPTIAGFRFLRYLGGGPVFEVWEVRRLDDTTTFALKTIRSTSADDPSALMLLKRELRAGTAVRHPRLGRAVGGNVHVAPFYVLCEYVPGESVQDRLDRAGGRLSVRSAVWVVRQAAEALAALHAEGLIHADVKPDNVRLLPTGEARLVDLAFTHRAGENHALHARGRTLGTPNYIAPEGCRRRPLEGPAADVFALGVTLFQTLTGELPYPGGTRTAALRARHTQRPRTLDDVPGRWPSRVADLVRAMLAVDPRGRPTATGVVRELVRCELELLSAAA